MKLNITKREVRAFLLGVLAMLLFVVIYEWKEFKAGFTGAVAAPTEITK